MNYGNSENWKYMTYSIKWWVAVLFLLPLGVRAQQEEVLSLPEIIKRIEAENLQLQSYGPRAESYRFKAEAATAWMPPMVGLGTFMTPYPGQKVMEARDRGMLMLRAEQEVPNLARLRAEKSYIESRGQVETVTRGVVTEPAAGGSQKQLLRLAGGSTANQSPGKERGNSGDDEESGRSQVPV